MTRVNFFSLLLILSAIMFLPFTTKAQVTIGSAYDPQPFSVLELFSNDTRGFRLPQLTTDQRNDMGVQYLTGNDSIAAMGLTIFNTTNFCVETWNGERWISFCIGETPPAPPIIINCDGRRMVVPQFAHFNLGGRVFETARAQMAYAASLEGPSTATNHGSLFGGRFQWGRADTRHAIGERFELWTGTAADVNSNAIDGPLPIARFDAAGQPLDGDDAAGRFITSTIGNWLVVAPTPHVANNHLWGNGVTIETQTDNLPHLIDPGVPGDNPGQYFQSTSWALTRADGSGLNDPCRTYMGEGWRLPTQDEWELIANYDCAPNLAASAFHVPADDVSVVPPGGNALFTWVRVSCIDGACHTVTTTNNPWTNDTRNGFVLYRTDELGGFEFEEDVNLLGANTPEPFLFLPAAGWRDTFGYVMGVGTSGTYWSSSFHDALNARDLWLNSDDVFTDNVNGRASGFSVRCVRD